MNKEIFIVDEDLVPKFKTTKVEVITPSEYIMNSHFNKTSLNVYNLSSHIGYQELGYYASLVAMARQHKVQPTPKIIQDFKDRKIHKLYSEELYQQIQTDLSKLTGETFELSVYFGENTTSKYNKLAKEFYRLLPAPMFRVSFKKLVTWRIDKLKLLTLKDLNEDHTNFVIDKINRLTSNSPFFTRNRKKYFYDIAILVNEKEVAPPSGKKALENFDKAFRKHGLRPYFIQNKDKPNISEYDALFIRETTNVTHHTYKMARQAQMEGLVVIDDPDSIVKCTNKIFLEQLMDSANIPRPKSVIMDKNKHKEQLSELTFPCIIKKPDSAFSQGVYKAANLKEFKEISKKVFETTELILVQEFLPTEYDWRIGILNNKVIYACKYYMVKGHWQIINNHEDQEADQGDADSIDPKLVDEKVLKIALKVTKKIGNGLYGVDLKQIGSKVYVIEVNDNPSIDDGLEDGGTTELYDNIASHFLAELHKKRGLDA